LLKRLFFSARRYKFRQKEFAMLGVQELMLILVIVVIIFGAKRIPEIMQGLGQGIKTFKRAMEDEEPSPPVESVKPGGTGSSVPTEKSDVSRS
jgi:sec-independent protein translocase protein TatA